MNALREFKTGAGALAVTIAPNIPYQLEEVRLHLSAAGGTSSESFTVAVDSENGSEYDVVLATQDMNAVSDYVFQPTRPRELQSGDAIKLSWANAKGQTWGLEVIYKAV